LGIIFRHFFFGCEYVSRTLGTNTSNVDDSTVSSGVSKKKKKKEKKEKKQTVQKKWSC
jgi:hypothetical protein